MDDELGRNCQARVGGTIRGKFRLDSMLGYGGMAAVYAATHRNGSRVALKVLHPQLAHIAELRNRFLREGYVANRIAHPGVVRIADDDDDDHLKTAFLVMELLEGATVQTSLDVLRGKLSVGEAVRSALGILDVLEVAHASGIIHRDLKPENVFLCSNGLVKVLDFGIARVAELASATRSGQILGTPAFMAPEQAAGRPRDIDARTDLWAVGALLFRVLTGRDVFIAGNPTVQLVYAATQPAPSLLSVNPLLSPALAEVVDRALLADRAGRWPSATEMKTALSAFSAPPGAASGGATQTIVQGSG